MARSPPTSTGGRWISGLPGSGVSWRRWRINAVVTVESHTYEHKIRLSDFQFHHDLDTGQCTAQAQQTNRVYPVLRQLKEGGLVQQAEAEAVRLRNEYAG